MIGISHSACIPTPTHSSPKSADENALNSFDVFFAEIVARCSTSECPCSSLAARTGGTRRLDPAFLFFTPLQIAASKRRLLLPSSSSSSSRETPEKDFAPEYTFKDDEKDKDARGPSRRRLFFERAEDVLALLPPPALVFDDGAFCARIRSGNSEETHRHFSCAHTRLKRRIY